MRGIRVNTDMNEVLTASNAAAILKMPVSSIYRYAESGRLKAYKKGFGRGIYFLRNDIEEFKASLERLELIVPKAEPEIETEPKTGKELGLKTFQGKPLTAKEVAKFMGVSARWVQAHMADRSFPIKWYPIGFRDRVIDSADLDKFLSRRMIPAGKAELPLKAVKKIKARRLP
jgi:predicted DNA-binding transcriptional regulator AlpA